jgi:hypothetical protein
MANEGMILELIKRWANWADVVPSLELFLNALDENPEASMTLPNSRR